MTELENSEVWPRRPSSLVDLHTGGDAARDGAVGRAGPRLPQRVPRLRRRRAAGRRDDDIGRRVHAQVAARVVQANAGAVRREVVVEPLVEMPPDSIVTVGVITGEIVAQAYNTIRKGGTLVVTALVIWLAVRARIRQPRSTVLTWLSGLAVVLLVLAAGAFIAPRVAGRSYRIIVMTTNFVAAITVAWSLTMVCTAAWEVKFLAVPSIR